MKNKLPAVSFSRSERDVDSYCNSLLLLGPLQKGSNAWIRECLGDECRHSYPSDEITTNI